jgi:hypothetical protein
MNMGRTEQGFMAAARAAGYAITSGAPVPGLTGRGHLEPGLVAAAPEEVIAALHGMFVALGGDEAVLRTKRSAPLRPDGLLGGRLLEVDEIQHFTTARLMTLDRYADDASVGFDRDEYQSLCRHWAPRGGDRYRASKPTVDFPRPGGRTAQRAYFDALRDLAAPYLSVGPVLRIPAPECDPAIALTRLRARGEST